MIFTKVTQCFFLQFSQQNYFFSGFCMMQIYRPLWSSLEGTSEFLLAMPQFTFSRWLSFFQLFHLAHITRLFWDIVGWKTFFYFINLKSNWPQSETSGSCFESGSCESDIELVREDIKTKNTLQFGHCPNVIFKTNPASPAPALVEINCQQLIFASRLFGSMYSLLFYILKTWENNVKN